LHRVVARYRQARKTLHTPASPQSTLITSFLFQGIGPAGGFIAIAAVAGAATALIWIFVTETRPSDDAN
jgi:hypothetical protein